MPLLLSAALRPQVITTVAELTVKGFLLPSLFPVDVVTTVDLTGVAAQNADACTSRAEALQRPGDLAGPLGYLARKLDAMGSLLAAQIQAELAAAPADAGGADVFSSLLLGSGRLLLDHTEFRSHLRNTLQANRPLIWLPSPLANYSRGCVDLVQDVASATRVQLAIAESEMGDARSVEELVQDLVFYLKPKSAFPAADTTRPAYVRNLASYLVQCAAELPKDVVLVFVDMRKGAVPDEWLTLLREVVRKIRNGNFENRVRAIMLGCDDVLGNGALVRTHVGIVEREQIKGEARSLLAMTQIDPNDYDALIDPWLAEPLDLEVIHAGVWGALEVGRG